MSLIVPSKFQKIELNERDQMIEHAKRRAANDFENEEAEALLKSTYEAEKARLRKEGSSGNQSAKPTSANPPKLKEPSAMQKQLNLERQANALQAQVPFVTDSQPAAPSTEVSEEDGQFAVKVIEVWKASIQAQKDFPDVAAFHAFCVECEEKEKFLKPHQKDICGLPYYRKSLNL